MALFIMILRKMINNKWLELSLLLGLVISVALTSSIPVYTDAILQRMLQQELKLLQINNNQYPGIYWLSASLATDDAKKKGEIADTDRFVASMSGRFGLPAQYFVRERATQLYSLLPAEKGKLDPNFQRSATIDAIEGLESHVELVDGRMPAKQPVDGVYEALVVPQALTSLGMTLNDVFAVNDPSLTKPIYIKPVGVIKRKDYSDLYWYNIEDSYRNSFFIDFSLFDKDITGAGTLNLQSSYWYYALDYTKITLNALDTFLNADQTIGNFMDAHFDNHDKNVPALDTIHTYLAKASHLRIVLWSLDVPVLLMLAFYLYMVANLITERQKTEIAVLRSRGASRLQIMVSYALEGIILGAFALLIGPYLGVGMTKLLGASSGFLQFVQRAKLDAGLNQEAYRYSLIGIGFSLVMTLIPVFLATKVSIVGHKTKSARASKLSFWHRYFFDVILIALAGYGLHTYQVRNHELLSFGLGSMDLQLDPLLFIIPAFFILGMGLLVLRLYPWFMKLLYYVGRRWWPPALYSVLIQVGRSALQYLFIMVFLIITIATGLFSASATRTINQNTADKIRYAAGADMTLQVHWENDAPPAILMDSQPSDSGDASGSGGSASDSSGSDSTTPQRVQYTEPAYMPFTQLPGVEHTAKVFIKNDAVFTSGKTSGKVELMGINTKDFGQTVWMRDHLLAYSFNAYLNLIAGHPSTVLISRSMQEAYKLNPGDTIMLNWQGVQATPFTVYGIIDYWPSWNPNPSANDIETVTSKQGAVTKVHKPMLVVGNLSYIQNNMALEPYQVWLKTKPGASSQKIYQALKQDNYELESLTDTNQEQIKALNDPFQLAVNGMMTLGFLISILISFCGFLLFWVLSLHGRTLQFGIFRAMGISNSQLILMLAGEQVLISGAAILIGVLTGFSTGRLFVPLFGLAFDPTTQVPPFQVAFNPIDQERLLLILTMMILIGLAILGYIVTRIRIHQAVKLGED